MIIVIRADLGSRVVGTLGPATPKASIFACPVQIPSSSFGVWRSVTFVTFSPQKKSAEEASGGGTSPGAASCSAARSLRAAKSYKRL